MDPLIHTLVGISISQVFGIGIDNPVVFTANIVLANLPDIDALSDKQGSIRSIFPHHGPTHSILGAIVFSASIAVAIYYIGPFLYFLYKPTPLLILFLSLLASILSHLFLDLFLQSDGISLLWPFSNIKNTFRLIIGLNPMNKNAICYPPSRLQCLKCQISSTSRSPILYALLLSIVGGLIWGYKGDIPGLLIMISFIFWLYLSRSIAVTKAKKTCKNKTIQAYPLSFIGDTWLILIRDDKEIATYRMQIFKESTEIGRYRIYYNDDPVIERTKEHFKVQDFLRASLNPFPWKKKVEEGYLVFWKDITYDMDSSELLFAIRILLDKDDGFRDVRFLEKWPKTEIPYNKYTLKPYKETGSI